MLHLQLVLIDDEDGVRGVYEAQIRQLCQMCNIQLNVVSCKTLADGEIHIRAPLPQTRRYSGAQNTTPSSFQPIFTIASISACDVASRWFESHGFFPTTLNALL